MQCTEHRSIAYVVGPQLDYTQIVSTVYANKASWPMKVSNNVYIHTHLSGSFVVCH